MLKSIFTLTLGLLSFATIANAKSNKSSKKNNGYTLVELSDNPSTAKSAVEGMEVKKIIKLDAKQTKSLEQALHSESNYIDVMRKCKLMPKYAVTVNGKVQYSFELSDCPKVKFYNKGKVEYKDLKLDSQLSNIVNQIIK